MVGAALAWFYIEIHTKLFVIDRSDWNKQCKHTSIDKFKFESDSGTVW